MIGSCLVGVNKERWMTRDMEEDKRRFLTVICHGLETKKISFPVLGMAWGIGGGV